MLFIIEAIGLAALCYYIAKYGSIKWALIIAFVVFACGLFGDLLLYQRGFTFTILQLFILSTAHNLLTSFIVNGVALIGSLSGVIWHAKA